MDIEGSAAGPPTITADLCHVTRAGDDVVLQFGQATVSDAAPGALQALLMQRVAMSEGGAAKLQDLLVDLLRAADDPAPPGR